MFDIHATNAPAFTLSVEGDEFRLIDANLACAAWSEMRPERRLGQRPQDYFPAELALKLTTHYRRCAVSALPISYETETVLPSGYSCWRTTLIPMVAPETGRVTTIFGVCIDGTSEKIAERAATDFQAKVSLALEAIDGGFWTLDPASGHFEASRALTDLLAGPDHPLLSLAEYLGCIYAEDLAGYPDTTQDSTVDFRVLTFDGRTRWMHSRRRAIRDATGKVVQLVALVLDVTDATLREKTLEHEATTDDMTGLKNRRGFERVATNLISYPFDPAKPLAFVLFDLDRFKPVNDVHGHKAGDEVLRELGKRLGRAFRRCDTVARIGGDEFAIVVRDGAAGVRRTVERLERLFAKPFRCGGGLVAVGASIGVATQVVSDRRLGDLMERADAALYSVKHRRRQLSA